MIIKNKRVLNEIAKRWARGILKATQIDCDYADEMLSVDEQHYILNQVHLIAEKISDKNQNNSLSEIISEYFEIVD